MKTVKIKSATISYDSRGFLRMEFPDKKVKVDLSEADKQVQAALEVSGGKRCPVLIDARLGYQEFSDEAFKHVANHSKMNRLRSAEALLVAGLSKALMARFYYLFHKPKNPLKVFTKENEAINWVLQFTEK